MYQVITIFNENRLVFQDKPKKDISHYSRKVVEFFGIVGPKPPPDLVDELEEEGWGQWQKELHEETGLPGYWIDEEWITGKPSDELVWTPAPLFKMELYEKQSKILQRLVKEKKSEIKEAHKNLVKKAGKGDRRKAIAKAMQDHLGRGGKKSDIRYILMEEKLDALHNEIKSYNIPDDQETIDTLKEELSELEEQLSCTLWHYFHNVELWQEYVKSKKSKKKNK